MTQYELRTSRGRPVMVFDNEARALQECVSRSARIGTKLSVWRIERREERVG